MGMSEERYWRPLADDPSAETVLAMFDATSEDWLLSDGGDYETAAAEVMRKDGSDPQRVVLLQWPSRKNHSDEKVTLRLMIAPEDALGLADVLKHTGTWMTKGTTQDPIEKAIERHPGAQVLDIGSASKPIPLKKLFEQLEKIEGSEMEFMVERAVKEDGRTFSEEAMEYLHQEVWLWIGTRITRAIDVLPGLPQKVSVVVNVAVDVDWKLDDE